MKNSYFIILGLLLLAGCSYSGVDRTSSSTDQTSTQITKTYTENAQNSTTKEKENQPISNVESTGNNPAEDSNVQEIKDSSTTTETIANESEKTDEYYRLIKQAWQEQSEYINSLTDPKVKQSVQTPSAAANAKASQLELDNPADTQLIQTSLKQVLNGQ
ncbi:hypothetical protein ACIMRZ_000114 [Enterococcus hirae]